MIRLLVNVPPHKAGSRIDPDRLDGDFVQRLIDAGQAEVVQDETPADPADVVQDEVFELIDQIDAAVQRRARVVMMLDGLSDGPGKAAVEAVLAAASQIRPELFGLDALPDPAAAEALQDQVADLEAARKLDAERIETLTERLTATDAALSAAETKLAALSASGDASADDPPPPAEPEASGKKPPRG